MNYSGIDLHSNNSVVSDDPGNPVECPFLAALRPTSERDGPHAVTVAANRPDRCHRRDRTRHMPLRVRHTNDPRSEMTLLRIRTASVESFHR